MQKEVKWYWGNEQENAFLSIKQELSADTTLAHYNPDARITLTVDASPWGLGAVLSQVEDGIERPISYASRSLNSAEKQYSQIQKEATAIIFGIRKYHQYLYGRADPFVLKTDHKPLLSIFKPGKGIPEVSANRLQRYALFLTAYNYVIEYVSSAHNCADYLSRSMVSIDEPSKQQVRICEAAARKPVCRSTIAHDDFAPDNATYCCFMWNSTSPPMSLREIGEATQSDKILAQVVRFTAHGWPDKIKDKTMKPFFDCRFELSIEKGCLMKGSRLVIPEALRPKIISELHLGHLGYRKMKVSAASKFWWPGMSASLRNAILTCPTCEQLRPAPPRAPLAPWPYPPEPWYRVHLDFLGPMNNKVYLVAVDAYSKWVEVYDVSTGYGSKVVIEKLCELMARFGLIHTICTDNGPSFVSVDFDNFCTSNGITHLTSPAYHPASNGQAESYVKIVKRALKAILLSKTNRIDTNAKLNEFLFTYRNSCHSSTNRSPAEILFGSNLRCRLDLLNPLPPRSSDQTLNETVKKSQCSQVEYYGGRRNIDFRIGDSVLVKVYKNQKTCWTRGTIFKKVAKTAYLVQLLEVDRIIKRHTNQIYGLRGERSGEQLTLPASSVEITTTVAEREVPDSWTEDNDNLPPIVIMKGPELLPPTDSEGSTRSQADQPAPTDTDEWADCPETISSPPRPPPPPPPPPSPQPQPQPASEGASEATGADATDARTVAPPAGRSRRVRKPVTKYV